ncbi:MAG TPA: DUF488 domain-containing protein [Puia sp.]|nr:DUF488 domain-containing protein [Puia sp.]
MEFFTTGVYNSNEQEFFDKLGKNGIDTFCDIRQRRGVRGSKYSFVNSNRLQERLAELGIKYGHVLGLAPSGEIRSLQKEADLEKGELKSERKELGEVFKREYEKQILDIFNFEEFIDKLDSSGAHKIVLFCVEEIPDACHRSLVAKKLKEQFNYKITHL